MATSDINRRVNWRLFFRLAPSILVVLLLLVYGMVNYDPFCKKKISEYLSKRVSTVVRTRVDLDFEYINPFTVTLHCSNINAHRDDWSCKIPHLTFQGSWATLLTESNFGLECIVDNGDCAIQIKDGTCSLFKIINDFLKLPSRKPFIVHNVILKNGKYTFQHTSTGFCSAGSVSLTTKMHSKQVYIKHVIHGMHTTWNDTLLFSVNNGSGEFLIKDNEAPQGTLYYTVESPLMPEKNGILYGICSQQEKFLNIYSTDRLWDISLSYANEETSLKGHILLNEIFKLWFPPLDLKAEIAFDVLSGEDIKGELLCENISCGTNAISSIKAWFENNADGLNGSFVVGESEVLVQGTVKADSKGMVVETSSCAPLVTPWLSCNDAEPLECFISSDYKHFYLRLITAVKPYFSQEFSPFHLTMKGNVKDAEMYAHCADYVFCVKKHQQQVNVKGTCHDNEMIQGSYNLDSKQGKLSGNEEAIKLIGDWAAMPITGKGNWQLNALMKDGTYAFDGCIDDGQIRIGNWYNLLEKVKVDGVFNPTSSALYINELHTNFRAGSLVIKDATVNTSNKTCTVPITFNNFLLTKQNEFFVQLNGYGCLTGPLNALKLSGFCLIDQSLIMGNILSSDLYKESNPSALDQRDILCDLIVMTKNEVPVKTPLFSTNAQCHLQVTGSLASPRLNGTIDFSNGSIYFPYDALFIKTGLLNFNAMTTEPSIELVAKNAIKNYDVTLGLHGGISNPLITLTSSPLLTKEQLIALLLGGAEDGSLSLIMPQSMTELFEQLLFGSTATISKTQKYIHSFFEPLKSVRLVPKFSDQTGRGGLRGALEIDVTDRLKASIQQNFSLTEDTRIDISYALSDEANIKATKDERGDVGCEIEMKWRW